jgi:membrane protein DedA with SNARE-associated domain
MIDSWIGEISGSPWTYVIALVIAALDAVIPFVPSEATVIAASVLAADGKLELPLVMSAAAAGAVAGDNLSYLIGRTLGHRIKGRFFRGPKAQDRLRWASGQLSRRGGYLIVVSRFLPGGRTVVTLSAGLTRMPWNRFLRFDLLAGCLWAAYASLLGYVGGRAFESELKGIFLGLGLALAVTACIEIGRLILRQRRQRRDAAV